MGGALFAKPAYQNPVMWQATSTGAVNGISGNVDIDFQFKDFTSVIPANTWRTINGQTIITRTMQSRRTTGFRMTAHGTI